MAFPQMIEPLQIKIIHTAVAKLSLSDDEYRDILQGHFKVSSSLGLNYFQASKLIDYFKTLGFKIPKRKRFTPGTPSKQDYISIPRKNRPPNVFVLPSRDQLEMIDTLAGKIKWLVEDGFHRWLQKYFRITKIKTEWEASNVIEGLKKLLDHQVGA
jgi:hypothetical protein